VQGAVGAQGPAGPAGQPGAPGADGAVGAGLDAKWPAVEKVSWTQDGLHPVAILKSLTITLTTPIQTAIRDAKRPGIIDVYYESGASAPPSGPQPGDVFVLHGQLDYSVPNQITWSSTDDSTILAKTVVPGGRIRVRIQCGHILDVGNRAYSAAADALTGVVTLRAPGGILESWFTIQ
jgi:hypothetical protein